MTHTPLECIGTDNGEYVISRRYPTGKRRTVAHVYEKGLQDTIVTAVNQHEALVAERDRLRAERDLLFNERIDTVNRLAETLKEAKDCIGRLVAACEQHHATSTCDSMALFAAANREYKQMDRIRAALAGKETP